MAREQLKSAAPSSTMPGTHEAPPVQTPGRRQRRAAETRLRLFRCALELFAQRGFQNVTVEEITEAADVGKGTFFNYFETKDHVLGVMAELQLGRIHDAVKEAGTGKRSIDSTLHQLFHRLSEEPGRSPFLARAMISSFLASEVVRGIMEDRMREARTLIGQIIAEGQRRGEIDPKLELDDTALVMQQSLLGTILLWSLHEEPELEVWIERSYQQVWRSIAAPGRERKL